MTTDASEKVGSNRLPALAEEIRRAHCGVVDAAKTAAERAIEAGNALVEAKQLVRHGEWGRWLKEHCQLSERTAQLYMAVAKSGIKPAIVADLGLQAASRAIVVHCRDSFDDCSEEELKEWLLCALQRVKRGTYFEQAVSHCEWLKRNAWRSPSEWFGPEGDKYRKTFGLKGNVLGLDAWEQFKLEYSQHTRAQVQSEFDELAAQQPEPVIDKRRKRRWPKK